MIERYDSRKELNCDFRKLLQERIEKANPRNTELTKEEVVKLAKLEGLAARLKRSLQ